MSWFIALFARLALLAVWLFTPLVDRAFHGGWLVPLLGILILPITTLAYVLVYSITGSVTGWGWLWVVLALLLDLAAHSFPPGRLPGQEAREWVVALPGPGASRSFSWAGSWLPEQRICSMRLLSISTGRQASAVSREKV